MSGRSTRKKKAPTKLVEEPDESDTPRQSRSRKSVQKPKYVTDLAESAGNAASLRSRQSSPESRPSTPANPRTGKRGRKTGTAQKNKKGPAASGLATPVNRNSRASSVSSTAKTTSKKSAKKPKLKTKLGRGYNPNLVNYKDSEYHYGSDFDDNDFEADQASLQSSDSEVSDIESASDDMKPESDVELEPAMIEEDSYAPDPFWLQEATDIPELTLPPSSDDLVVAPSEALDAVSVYEVLRQFFKIIRLSPFRFEDFCYALNNEEQSNLLSEIHICLLKALIREDDLVQAQYGPLDQKDSMNVFIYFIDAITWPENLRFFLSADAQANEEILEILEGCEYPFTSVTNRLAVLRKLTDGLLSTSAVRDDLVNEDSTHWEDHCRVCHRLGDMVVCEHCNGPFHGTCLDPPLYEVPDEDWICPVCVTHMVEGVYDCPSTDPGSCRIPSLGTDRHGNRYWFACRRLWIQDRDEEPRYYSTRAQLTELLEVLDRELYEKELYDEILAKRDDFEAQMDLTERLTSEKNNGQLKTYLDMDNVILEKLQKERNDLREYQEMERRKIQEDIDRQIREEDRERKQKEKERMRKEKEEKLERIRKEREARMKRREEMKGDGPAEDLPEDDADLDAELQTLAEEEEEEVQEDPDTQVQQAPPKPAYNGPYELKRGTMPAGNYFRLGEENTCKNYVNQYTLHHHALSRAQSKEESEKRSRLSHKFSLTEASSFKWIGSMHGTRNQLAATVRQTILQLENNIPMAFMHTNWSLLRKPWIQAVSSCNNPSKDFSRALTVLTCCIKPCILLPVWTDSLGHTMVKKIGYQGKEEKKRMEKREKKEREDEEERLRPYMTWVKYTLPVRSLSVVRQKGEEYRAHGRNGWLWISNTRNYCPKDSLTLGLRAGPHRIAVKYTELKTNNSKVVLMEPKAFRFLMEVQKERDDRALARAVAGEPEPSIEGGQEIIDVEKSEEEKRRESLTKVLDMSRLDIQEAKEEDLGGSEGVVDVSKAIVNPTRLVYPKAAKKCKVDDLLARRIQLKNLEEKRFELDGAKNSTETEEDTKTTVTSDIVTDGQPPSLETWISQSKLSINKTISALSGDQLNRSCYSPQCQLELSASCYSPSCRSDNLPRKLLDAAKVYQQLAKEFKMRKIKDLKLEDDLKFDCVESALAVLEDLLKLLKVKEEEPEDPSAIQSISNQSKEKEDEVKKDSLSVLKSEVKSDELGDQEEGEEEEGEKRRIYSHSDTTKGLYLKRIQSVAEARRPSRIVKYPLAPTFYSRSHGRRNILICSKHDVRKLARTGGLGAGEGFNYNSKANQAFWPYPCPRPIFKTAWLFRTAGMTSLHSVAMQLRIVWMCLRWDDMNSKPPNTEGKNQVTTENGIVSTEILKHRNRGRFLEQTQYYQRRISIPLDQPRKQVDYSPIRSGLRKRKRVESPVQAEPQVEEKWIDEADLELWEIRAYKEKIERERNAAVTRRQVGTSIKAPEKFDPSEETKKRTASTTSNAEMKAKIDAHIKEQREAFKASRSTTPDLPNSKPSLAGVGIKKAGESIKIVAANANQPTYTTSIPGAKKIFISRDGKIIGHQMTSQAQPPAPSTPSGKIAIAPAVSKPSVPAVTTSQSPQQKVQIVKTADGKIQVRGLLPGQQLVQMPDGKLQIFSNPTGGGSPSIKLASATDKIISPSQPSVITQPQQQQQLIAKPVVQPTTNVIQNAKTYTIQRPANVTPIQPKPSLTGITPNPNISLSAAAPNQRMQVIQPNSVTTTTTTTTALNSVVNNSIVNNTPGVIQSVTSSAASPAKPNTLVGIQSLGQNTVSVKDNQLIVQGPDHEAATAIAQQLASGQAKLANLGGKQVLLITNPQQAKSDSQPQQQVTSTQPQLLAKPQQHQQQQQQPAAVQYTHASPQQITSQQYASPQQQQQQLSTSSQLHNSHQMASPQKDQLLSPQQQQQLASPSQQQSEQQTLGRTGSITVTAQLVQTAQGPRIVLQGLQGMNLSEDQLISIQQQVKTQLLKQQALARQQGKVPPTRVTLELMLSSVCSSAPQQSVQGGSSMPNTPDAQGRVESGVLPIQSTQKPEKPKPKIQTVSSLPENIIKQGKYVMRDGKKILVLPPHVMQEYKESLRQQQQKQQPEQQNLQQQQQQQQTQESLLLPNQALLSPSAGGLPSPGDKLLSPTAADADKFELTDEYIQQTIKEALESGNLAPDIEEKLMNQLEDTETFKVKGGKVGGSGGRNRGKKKPVYDPISGDRMDDEWEPQSWTKNKISNQLKVEREKREAESREPIEQAEATPPAPLFSPPTIVSPKPKVKVVYSTNRLGSILFKHKEQLKKDIAKKRNQLEKELSIEIAKDVESLKKQAALKLGAENASLISRKLGTDTAEALSRKRRSEAISPAVKVKGQEAPPQPTKKRRKSDKRESSGDKKWKKDRLYCICKTPYDDTKFYVGCDVCSNWFHGTCVGITPKMSKKLSEYVCEECTNAKEGSETYCLCQEPYDEARFYIGCEKCPDWFHGRCVGILQCEAGSIEEYECPRCNPTSKINQANLKKLRAQDLDAVRKLFKQIQGCKYSQPFRHPVDKKSNKKYYDVVKEPMDLETIEKKLGTGEYKTLAHFLGDVTRIVENCRYFNPPGTPISNTAENLEKFVHQKLAALREKLLTKK